MRVLPPKPPSRKAAPDERAELAGRIARALGISREEAEVRALRELAERVAPEKPAAVDLLGELPTVAFELLVVIEDARAERFCFDRRIGG